MDQAPSALHVPPDQLPRRLFTIAEYHRMGEVGILTRRERVELIEGEIVQMSAVGGPHTWSVNRLNRALVEATGDRAVVSAQLPVEFDAGSEPMPDFALLRPRDDEQDLRIPQVDEVLLLIEVAVSSLAYDCGRKRALYARHGVPEYWIVNLVDGEVEVCRDPTPEGHASVRTACRGELLPIAALPPLAIPVQTALDPAPAP